MSDYTDNYDVYVRQWLYRDSSVSKYYPDHVTSRALVEASSKKDETAYRRAYSEIVWC